MFVRSSHFAGFVLRASQGILDFAFSLPVGLELLVYEQFAGASLDLAAELLSAAFSAVLVSAFPPFLPLR